MPDETHNAPAPSSPSVPAKGEGITSGSYVNGERERVSIEFCQRHGEGEPLPVLTLYDDAPPVGSGQRAPMLLDVGTRQWLAERLGFAAKLTALAEERDRLAKVVDTIKAAHAERTDMMRQGMDVKTATLGCHVAVAAALSSPSKPADSEEGVNCG